MIRRFLPLLLMMAAPAWAQPRTVILVRHAETAGAMGGDIPLTDAGRCRATNLTGVLADAGIRHIFTSEVSRTKDTAAPLARKLNVTPEVLPGKDIDGLVAKLASVSGNSLVVGHSNTVPEIVAKLGGGAVPPIGEAEFDRMFVVTITGPKQTSLVTLRYKGCGQ